MQTSSWLSDWLHISLKNQSNNQLLGLHSCMPDSLQKTFLFMKQLLCMFLTVDLKDFHFLMRISRDENMERVQTSCGTCTFSYSDWISLSNFTRREIWTFIAGLIQLTSLRFLLLDNNKLATIPSDFVQVWQADHTLSDVTLFGNPLYCDQLLAPLVNWVQTSDGHSQICVVVGRTGDKTLSGTCPVCDGPSRLRGKPIDTLGPADLGTSSSPSEDGSSFSSRLINGRPVAAPSSASRRGGSDADSESVGFVVKSGSGSNTQRDADRGSVGSSSSSARKPVPAGTRCTATTCYVFSAV